MSEPNGKGWKAALLATGKPLEKSVAERVLEVEGVYPARTYHFERFDRDDNPVPHSVDLLASLKDIGRDIVIEFLVESKYRSRPKTWIYRKSEAAMPGGVSTSMYFQSTDDLLRERHFNRIDLAKIHDFRFSLGYDPSELSDPVKTNNFGQCDDGGRQLSYAVASRMAEAALETLRDGQLRFVLPMTVTTADLRILKSNPTMKEVAGAKSLEDLVEEVDLVVSRFPSPDLEKHIISRLLHLTNNGNDRRVNKILSELGIHGLSGLAKSVAARMDGTYVVLKYERLTSAMAKSISYCMSSTRDRVNIRGIGSKQSLVIDPPLGKVVAYGGA